MTNNYLDPRITFAIIRRDNGKYYALGNAVAALDRVEAPLFFSKPEPIRPSNGCPHPSPGVPFFFSPAPPQRVIRRSNGSPTRV
jgi:hypothetical protein